MSEIGYCGLARNYDRLPPHARVTFSGTLERQQAVAEQRQAPAPGVMASAPQPVLETHSTTLTRVWAAIRSVPEPATTIADRAGLDGATTAICLRYLAKAERIGSQVADNPLSEHPGQHKRCWLYWTR